MHLRIPSGLRNILRIYLSSSKHAILTIYKTKSGAFGFTVILMFIAMATFGPLLVPLDTKADISKRYLPPSLSHPLGTDYAGRDVLSQVIWGSRDVMAVGLLAGIITVSIGVIVGIVSGFKGGILDTVLCTVMDIMLTIPGLPLMIVLAVYIRAVNPLYTALILSITPWASLARAIRSQVLSMKEREFIEAAKVLGLSTFHIMFREILPNLMPYVAVNFMFAVIGAIYASVGLYMLGVLPFTALNWGVMLNLATHAAGALFSLESLHYLLAPIIFLALLQSGFVLFSRAVDEVFNPRLREY